MWSDSDSSDDSWEISQLSELGKIERLRDWLEWKRQVEWGLKAWRLGPALKDLNPPTPPNGADGLPNSQSTKVDPIALATYEQTLKGWTHWQAQFCAVIRLRCLQDNACAMLFTSENKTVKELFAALERTLAPDPRRTLSDLYASLSTMSTANFKSLREYNREWYAIGMESRAIGAPLPGPWLVEGYLMGLGTGFEEFRVTWKTSHAWIPGGDEKGFTLLDVTNAAA